MVNFKEIYHFSRFQRGSNIFQGDQLFPGVCGGGGGSNCLFPIETHITCDFPGWGGGSGSLPPPPGSALACNTDFPKLYLFMYNHMNSLPIIVCGKLS